MIIALNSQLSEERESNQLWPRGRLGADELPVYVSLFYGSIEDLHIFVLWCRAGGGFSSSGANAAAPNAIRREVVPGTRVVQYGLISIRFIAC